MFGLSRLEIDAIGAAILLAILLLWLGFHDAKVRSEAVAPVIASVQAAEQAASAAQAIKAAKTDAEQAQNLHEATAQNAARAADARDLAADVRRMRDDAVRSVAAAPSTRPASAGQAGVDAGADVVPRELYARALAARASAESDAADLAAYAGGLLTSGQLCVSDYGSAQ